MEDLILRVNGEIVNLRDYPYRDELDRLILPLQDGTDLACKGDYPVSIKFGNIDYTDTSGDVTISNDAFYKTE